MLLHRFLEQTAERLPEKAALVCDGASYRYREINEAAARIAAALSQRGVRRGDRVAIFMDNSAEAVIAIYAALKIGAVFMPVNALTKTDKLAYMLNDARAACLVTHCSLHSVWGPALAQSSSVHTCIVAGEASYAEAAAADPAPGSDELIDQDLAAIIYTSGSTGDPKGVMLSHLNMVTAVNSVSGYLGYREDDVILCVLPLAFDYGLYQVLMGFKVGARVVLERNFAFPARILEVMARERVTVLPGVPTIFTLLMNLGNLSRYELGRLRMITNTAAALSEEHIRRLRALFPQATLYSMYGLTECKRVTYLPPEELDIRPTSVGRGMPNEEVWLVDETGRRLPNGATGELVIRGSHVMRGYWEKPAETAERLRPGPYPGELVLYSGDIFRTDAEGYLYFVARKDDIIKSRGEKVSPREVENALYSLPGVLEAAVVGVPDPVLGEAVKAVVVLAPGHAYSEKEMIRHCLSKLENFMAPKYVEFVDSIPKTNTGKIRKLSLV
jgi:long-chain acyl-CoA synthetase